MRTRILLTTALATTALALPAAALAHADAPSPSAQAAHAGVEKRTPAPGSTARNVKSVAITFEEKVLTGRVDVYRGGKRVAPRSSGPNGATVKATFARKLAAGTYTVKWRAMADDGHVQTGSWSFKAR